MQNPIIYAQRFFAFVMCKVFRKDLLRRRITAPDRMQTVSAPETAAPRSRFSRYSKIDHCQGVPTSEVGFSVSLSTISQFDFPLRCESDSALKLYRANTSPFP